MPRHIIHKDGRYNIFSTIVDDCYFEPSLSLKELEEYFKEEYGNRGLEGLPSRLERAHKTGTSSQIDKSLEDTVSCNNSGVDGNPLTFDEFVLKYLSE